MKGGGVKHMFPKELRYRWVSKEGKTFLNDDMISMLNESFLFQCVGTWKSMVNTMGVNKNRYITELTTPIGLNAFYITIKLGINYIS